MNVVGIMSGTSLDGVDFVLTRLGGGKPLFKDMASVDFPTKLKEKLTRIAEGRMNFRKSQLVHFELGEFYNKSLEKIKKNKKWKIDLIGLHGQTVFHQAPDATTQIGEPSFLKSFGVPVVSDFRSKILAAGGQGAPLAPLFHNEILSANSNKKSSWAFLNIGGMTNITQSSNSKLTATDLGPGNILLDKAAKLYLGKDFDKGGALALCGLPDLAIAKDFIKQTAFFSKKVPKSCGREEFSDQIFRTLNTKMKKLSPEDKMATLAEITLIPIYNFLKTREVSDLIVSGGGVHNQYLTKGLSRTLSGTHVKTSESAGWPSQAVEGGAFAYLAYLKIADESVDLTYMGLKKKLSPLGRVD